MIHMAHRKIMVILCLCLLTSSCAGFYAGARDTKRVYRLKMTKAEVRKVFGEPFRVDKGTYLGKEVEIWDYNYGNGSGVRLCFCKDCKNFYSDPDLGDEDRVVVIFYRPLGTWWREGT